MGEIRDDIRLIIYVLFCVATGMIAHKLYHDVLIAIIAGVFAPISWIKWLICHEVTLSVLKATFDWFFK
jgi:hypothetical protein